MEAQNTADTVTWMDLAQGGRLTVHNALPIVKNYKIKLLVVQVASAAKYYRQSPCDYGDLRSSLGYGSLTSKSHFGITRSWIVSFARV
jgi:hypothetical protein